MPEGAACAFAAIVYMWNVMYKVELEILDRHGTSRLKTRSRKKEENDTSWNE